MHDEKIAGTVFHPENAALVVAEYISPGIESISQFNSHISSIFLGSTIENLARLTLDINETLLDKNYMHEP